MKREHILRDFATGIWITTKGQKEECWCQPGRDEAERGRQARRALAELGLYPDGPLELDSAFGVIETNCRAALVAIVTTQLGRTDLLALWGLVRLLALTPRDDEIFEYVNKLIIDS